MPDSSFATIEWKVKKVIHINSYEEKGLREYKNAKYKKKNEKIISFVSFCFQPCSIVVEQRDPTLFRQE